MNALLHLCRPVQRLIHRKEVDEKRDDGDGFLVGPVFAPFDDDANGHVSKGYEHEYQLGNGFKKYVGVLLEVNSVQQLHEDSQQHVDDSQNDGELHFERIYERGLVF